MDTFIITFDNGAMDEEHRYHLNPELSIYYLCLYLSAGFKHSKEKSLAYGFFSDILPMLEQKLNI